MDTVERIFDTGEKIIKTIISVLLMLMTAVIFYQVILRYVFHDANIWAEEFARYSFIWVVLLGSSSAIRNSKHIRIDFLVQSLSPKNRKIIDFFVYSLMIIFLVFLTIYGFSISMKTGNQISAGLHIRMSFMYMSIPIGSILMLLATLEIMINDFILKKDSSTGSQV